MSPFVALRGDILEKVVAALEDFLHLAVRDRELPTLDAALQGLGHLLCPAFAADFKREPGRVALLLDAVGCLQRMLNILQFWLTALSRLPTR